MSHEDQKYRPKSPPRVLERLYQQSPPHVKSVVDSKKDAIMIDFANKDPAEIGHAKKNSIDKANFDNS